MNKIIPLIAVAVGWLLSELSSLVRLRREDRRAAGPVLADLLEIRHRLLAVDEYVKEVGKQIPIPSQDKLQLQQWMQTLFPEPPRFIEKYEEAVLTLARVAPIRAFRLRGQPLMVPLLASLRGLAASTKADAEIWGTILEPEFLGRFKPHIEELILDVARAHGWVTWWRARRRLRQPTLSEADRKWISNYIDQLKKAGEGRKQT